MRVVDESGEPAETGRPGELVARGANVMRGYWKNQKETELAFRAGMFRTGDVGYQDADGYFFILDRLKDLIVTGGENVYSGEVEAVIYQHPTVREAAVFGVPDTQWGEIGLAIIAVKPGQSLTENEILAHCANNLARFKCPRLIRFVDALPRNATGKIHKPTLRKNFSIASATDTAGAAS